MRFTKKLFGTFASILFVAACADLGSSSSSLSVQSGDCTLTQGYWKNHEEAWPVSSLKLGNVTYSKAALLAILRTPVKGNGLISLSHQLIAAKLNVAAGANDADIDDAIADADALIGNLVVGTDSVSTNATSGLVGELDAFNNGKTGPGHCDDNDSPPSSCDNDDDSDSDTDSDTDGDSDGDSDTDSDSDGDCDGEEEEPTCDHDIDNDGDCDPVPACGNYTVEAGEACDDGNVIANDGCSATCQLELPVCGNGVVEGGEECDDGNLTSGDGCSSACICDCPPH